MCIEPVGQEGLDIVGQASLLHISTRKVSFPVAQKAAHNISMGSAQKQQQAVKFDNVVSRCRSSAGSQNAECQQHLPVLLPFIKLLTLLHVSERKSTVR